MKKVVGYPAQDGTIPNAPTTGTVPAGPVSINSSEQSSGELPAPATQQRQRPQPRSLLPPGASTAVEILVPSVTVGAGAAVAGALVGFVSGVIRSDPAAVFSILAAGQWFTLGTSYYAARQVAFKAYGGAEDMTAFDKVKASGIAGGFAGMMGGMLRGRKNVVPGLIVWSLFGASGQALGSALSGRSFGTKYLASRWSPVTPLTDQQYEKMLEEKLLKVDAEIAIINDNINEKVSNSMVVKDTV